MLKFMLVIEYAGEATAHFFNSYDEALSCAMDCECGIGADWQLYEWNSETGCYEYLQS